MADNVLIFMKLILAWQLSVNNKFRETHTCLTTICKQQFSCNSYLPDNYLWTTNFVKLILAWQLSVNNKFCETHTCLTTICKQQFSCNSYLFDNYLWTTNFVKLILAWQLSVKKQFSWKSNKRFTWWYEAHKLKAGCTSSPHNGFFLSLQKFLNMKICVHKVVVGCQSNAIS